MLYLLALTILYVFIIWAALFYQFNVVLPAGKHDGSLIDCIKNVQFCTIKTQSVTEFLSGLCCLLPS